MELQPHLVKQVSSKHCKLKPCMLALLLFLLSVLFVLMLIYLVWTITLFCKVTLGDLNKCHHNPSIKCKLLFWLF